MARCAAFGEAPFTNVSPYSALTASYGGSLTRRMPGCSFAIVAALVR